MRGASSIRAGSALSLATISMPAPAVLAVGVHTTQFAIREADLYQPVLELAIRTAAEWSGRPLVMIAGAVGRTTQAVQEAQIARGLGYHAVLLSLAAMQGR